MGDIVERLRGASYQHEIMDKAADEIERLESQLEAARHEARAATKLVLEHQAKNCHLHAKIGRLRAALREVERCADVQETVAWTEVRNIAREALDE